MFSLVPGGGPAAVYRANERKKEKIERKRKGRWKERMGMEPRVVVTQGAAENARDQGFFSFFAETSITPAQCNAGNSARPAQQLAQCAQFDNWHHYSVLLLVSTILRKALFSLHCIDCAIQIFLS